MARLFDGQVRERHIHINVECIVGYWILHEQSTTSYFPLADDIPFVGGRSYKLRVHYAGHVNIFIRLIRLVPRSSDIVIRSSYAAILRRRFVVRLQTYVVLFSCLLVCLRVVTSDRYSEGTFLYKPAMFVFLCCWLLTETVSFCLSFLIFSLD